MFWAFPAPNVAIGIVVGTALWAYDGCSLHRPRHPRITPRRDYLPVFLPAVATISLKPECSSWWACPGGLHSRAFRQHRLTAAEALPGAVRGPAAPQ